MELDLATLQGWVGRSMEAEDIVTPRLTAEYRATFDPNLAPVGDGDAPLALHWCLAPPIVPMKEIGPDGHAARGGFLPPVPLPRRMWAGGEIETLGALRVGDTVVRKSTITDVTVKEGRSGRLCFVAVRHELASPRGLAIVERHDIVYRDAPAAGSAPPPEPPPAAERSSDLTWQVAADPVLLFRYSAITFNGHRIHYDHPYVTGEEGYAGLVVHGPIQATLLYNMAAVLNGGTPPKRFRYRGLSPLIGAQVFTVSGAKKPDGGLQAWTTNAAGRLCMEAETAS